MPEAPAVDVSATALNGAQADFLVSIVSAVARGELPKSSAIEAVRIALPMVSTDQIVAMFRDVVPGSAAPDASP